MDNFPLALSSVLQRELIDRKATTPDYLNGYGVSLAREEAIVRLQSDYLKKFERSNDEADNAAIQLFHSMNERCKEYLLPMERTESLSPESEQLFGTFLMLVEDFFLSDVGSDCAITWDNVVHHAKHGPGAAVGSRGTSFYAKTADSPITSTSLFLDDLYEASLYSGPYAVTTESFRRRHHGGPVRVLGSRMAVVPKNEKISRLICVEPVINQYLQQGMGEILTIRLKRLLSIDLASQPDVNRLMAYTASKSDGLATVDLKSASDTLSLKLLNYCIPNEIFSMLVSLRSPEAEVKGVQTRLAMMSSMGNGFTFPLQTVIFSCAVLAALWCDGTYDRNPRSEHRPYLKPAGFSAGWSVFGDDIVIKSRAYHKLEILLKEMGCIVNADKTFSSGSFRESCGRDFFHGYNVRPVYLKRLQSRADFTVALNQLLDWCRRTRIPLPLTIGFLLEEYRRKGWKLNLVPLAENHDAGLRVEFNTAAILAAVQVNTNGSFLYEARISRPNKYTIRDNGQVVGPRGSKSLRYNPDGLFRAFLLGEVRNGQIIAKGNGPIPYSTTRCVTPNWDYVPYNQEYGDSYTSDVPIASGTPSLSFLVDVLQRHFEAPSNTVVKQSKKVERSEERVARINTERREARSERARYRKGLARVAKAEAKNLRSKQSVYNISWPEGSKDPVITLVSKRPKA